MYRVLIFFSFFITQIIANPLNIGEKNFYETKNYLQYTLAEVNSETIESLKNRQWFNSKTPFNNLENWNKAYWVKLQVKNDSLTDKDYYFQVEHQFTFHIELFLVRDGNLSSYFEDGLIVPRSEHILESNQILMPIAIKKDEELEIFIKIQNYNKTDIKFSLVNKEYLLIFFQQYNFLQALFFGAMLIIMFYNLFLFFILRMKIYFYYVAYIFFSLVYFLGFFDYLDIYIPTLNSLFISSSGLIFLLLTLFVQELLKLKEKLPKINFLLNLFNIFFIISVIITTYSTLISPNFFYVQLIHNIFFIIFILHNLAILLPTYYLAYAKNDSIAKFYSIIWTCVFVVFFTFSLGNLNIIDINVSFIYLLQVLALLEVILFSFVLAYHVRIIEIEKHQQEKLLIKQSKLASMGEMISLIAHQWRQPLSTINGIGLNICIEYQKNTLNSEKLYKHLDDIENRTSFLSNTINDFTNFLSVDKKIKTFYIADIITEAKALVVSNKHNIKIEYKEENIIEFKGYKSELIQSFLVLLNNAIYACEKNITPINNAYIKIYARLVNKSLLISVEDNGAGIDEKKFEKIFDPYFTTKEKSDGTGLGLYILRLIIRNSMQGEIFVRNGKEGAIFTIELPLVLKGIEKKEKKI